MTMIGRAFVFKLTFFAGLGGFLFGFDTGVISGALPTISKHFNLGAVGQEVVVSGAVAGAIFGAAAGGPAADRFGRRPVILQSAFVFIAGAACMALAPDVGILVTGRVLAGLGVGLASMSVPVYISEAAPQDIRGALVGSFVLFITGGQFISYLVDYAFAEVHEGWRWMLGLSAAPAILMFIGMLGMPESPRWFVMKGNVTSAEKVFRQIRSTRDIDDELQSVKRSLGDDVPFFTGVKELLKPGTRRATALGLGLQALQQLCGINTVMYYSTAIVRLAGFTRGGQAILLSLPIAFANFAMTGVAVRIIDNVGRRKLLLWTLPFVGFSLLALSLCFYIMSQHTPSVTTWDIGGDVCGLPKTCNECVRTAAASCGFCHNAVDATGLSIGARCLPGGQSGPDGNKSPFTCADTAWLNDVCPSQTPVRYAALPAVALYICFFAVGMGPVPWAINSEIFAMRLRATANSLATIVNWTVNLIVSMTFLSLVQLLTTVGVFLVYAGFCVIAWLFVFVLLPETAKKSLEEVLCLFQPTNCDDGRGSGSSVGSNEGVTRPLMSPLDVENTHAHDSDGH